MIRVVTVTQLHHGSTCAAVDVIIAGPVDQDCLSGAGNERVIARTGVDQGGATSGLDVVLPLTGQDCGRDLDRSLDDNMVISGQAIDG